VPFTRPSLAEISSRVRTEFQARLPIGPLLSRSVLSVVAKVLAGLSHMAHGHIDWAERQALPDTADKERLEGWAFLANLTRKAATFSRGSVTFTGVDGMVIPSRRKMRRSDGLEYESSAAATVLGGIATCGITCRVEGAAGDSPSGTPFTLLQPIASVSSVGSGETSGGLDAETDEELRVRVLAQFRHRPQGGAPADYETWALEVAGVTRAWARPLVQGIGTAGLTFATDTASTGPIPTASKVQEVRAYISDRNRMPVGVRLVVFAPAARVISIVVRVSPDSEAVRSAVIDALKDLFRREGEPGETFYVSHIREAISGAAGELDSVLFSPVLDIVPAVGELPVLGSVTFA